MPAVCVSRTEKVRHPSAGFRVRYMDPVILVNCCRHRKTWPGFQPSVRSASKYITEELWIPASSIPYSGMTYTNCSKVRSCVYCSVRYGKSLCMCPCQPDTYDPISSKRFCMNTSKRAVLTTRSPMFEPACLFAVTFSFNCQS